jgi:glucose-6-phosphate isomerase
MGLDIEAILQGAADMTERFAKTEPGDNPVLDYVGIGHLMEAWRGATVRVLSTWGKRLEALGLWYDQLLSESLGKNGQGATPITAVNTRDLHSRGQQHQDGRRDKLITNVIVENVTEHPVAIPSWPANQNQDKLNSLSGKTLPQVLEAAIAGTNQAYFEDFRPTASIMLPQLDEHVLGQIFQMLMLATSVEGRLIGINPYGQPGVEGYKRHMKHYLGVK